MQFAGIICGFQWYTEDHKLFQQIVSTHQDTPKHIIVNIDDKERDRKISKEKGPFGDGCRLVNFYSLKLSRLLSCRVQSVSSFRRQLRCNFGKTKAFPDLDITTNN